LKKSYAIPFDASGHQLEWAGHYSLRPIEMRENFVFEDTLIFDGDYSKGRSAVTFHLKREQTGTNVTMFLSDFAEISKLMVNGRLTGRFTFCKKGTGYGCCLAK
jgi:hypothetical protein